MAKTDGIKPKLNPKSAGQIIEDAILTNSKELDLANAGLKSLAGIWQEIQKIKLLKRINLSGNNFLDFPQELFELQHLDQIEINNNSITEIPENIHKLTQLRSLEAYGNCLVILPTSFGNIQSLEKLNIGGNRFSCFPIQILELRNLKELYIHNNLFGDLPPEFSQLQSLELFAFGGIQLKIFPLVLTKMTSLTTLRMGNTKIRIIPDEIQNLKNICFLSLHNNQIIAIPNGLLKLTELSEIALNDNQISFLPPEIGNLVNLKRLSIPRNQLSDIPKEIGSLTQLTHLQLNDNNISSLPKTLENLKSLQYLDLTRNKLAIPMEIITKMSKPQSILNYYFSVIEQRQKSLNEIKILIVGQGSVGKTSLAQRILYGIFDQNQAKTEGISINQWQIDNRHQATDNRSLSSIKLNIWDFGGQEIMHATHQFFLTKRSLYLLVLDARLTQEENRVEYWLKIIQSFGGESPVLIVGNKTDQHPLDIDRTGLQKKYPNIVGFLETSAATGAGIETLKVEIAKQVNALPHVHDLLPETWFTVKTKLEKLGQETNFISHDDYDKLCDLNNVHDEASQHTLIGFLHDLGIVLYFQDDPRLESLGILNPQWVTNGVYKILNSHELFQNQGVLTLGMLDEILNVPEYPRGKRLYIVDMMKKFELCYDIEPGKTFLVPDLLPKDQPLLKFSGTPAFEYQYPVLPSSVMTRFIVRMNRHIQDNLVWRSGVVLKIGENIALVKADTEDKTISIAIDGLEHTRRDALSAIRYQLDEIHSSIKGLNPQKRVPIPNAPNAEPLDYDYLLQLERDNELEVLPVKDGARLVKVNIRQLLSGIESETRRKDISGNITNIYVGGNVDGNLIAGDENDIS